jgi:hypothetical protein
MMELRNQINDEYVIRLRALDIKASALEQQVKDYERTFEIMRKQIEDKTKAFNELASINHNIDNLMKELNNNQFAFRTAPQFNQNIKYEVGSEIPLIKNEQHHEIRHGSSRTEARHEMKVETKPDNRHENDLSHEIKPEP